MSDHEFERQVKGKMDELKLSPSSSVWQAVEADLDQRKRRRRGLIWVPTLLLLLLTGGYFIVFTGSKTISNTTISKNETPASTASKPREELESSAPTPLKIPPAEENKRSNSISNNKTVQESSSLNNNNLNNHRRARLNSSNNGRNDKELYRSNSRTIRKNKIATNGVDLPKDFDPTNAPVTAQRGNISGKNIAADTDAGSTTSSNRIAPRKSIDEGKQESTASSEQQKIDENKIVEAAPELKDSIAAALPSAVATPKVNKPAKSRKWQFGISGSAGLSNIKEGSVFELKQAVVQDISTSAPLGNVAPTFGFIYKPAVIKPRLAYSVSLFAQRDLSKRLTISIGFGYTQFNTSSEIGKRIDSTRIVNNGSRGYANVDSYFTPEQSNEYKMKYHFIDVPISARYRINNTKNLPIYLNLGLTGSKFIGTNALHFDGTTGVYYRNDELFNKLHLGATTGVSIGILNRSAFPLTVGPVVRYQVSRLLHKDVSGGNHLVSFGAEVRMLLRK